MKIFIVHDSAGNIVSAAASADPDSGQAVLAGADGHDITAVDTSGLQLPGARAGQPPELLELAAHLTAHYRVEHGRLHPRGS